MDDLPRVASGETELRRLIDAGTFDLRALDVAGFRRWLHRHLERWERDPVFVQQARIRELRRAHPALRALEAERRRAMDDYRTSGEYGRLEELERGLTDAAKAVEGLEAAMRGAQPERRSALAAKLRGFRELSRGLGAEHESLLRSSTARRALLRVEEELRELGARVGLGREEERLAELMREQGRRSGRAGRAFEEEAVDVARRRIVPRLPSGEPVRLLQGVTLGAARMEIDLLLVNPPAPGEPARVLAMIEVKRNPNDLAHGFRQRQENLAWLTGDRDAYDPARYRTRRFASGHFDREAVHAEGGEALTFGPASFLAFQRDSGTGLFLDRLWFISRPGPLWGISAAALARIRHRVATDERWEAQSDEYLAGLLDWSRSLAHPLETPDVLDLYAAGWGEQVLLLER